jgi:hypothetical protein
MLNSINDRKTERIVPYIQINFQNQGDQVDIILAMM